MAAVIAKGKKTFALYSGNCDQLAMGTHVGVPKYLPELLRLVSAGNTLQSAGQRVGVSRSTAHRLVQRFGNDVDRRIQPRLSLAVRQEIFRLRSRGLSIYATALRLKVSRTSVRRYGQQPSIKTTRCPTCGSLLVGTGCLACQIRTDRN